MAYVNSSEICNDEKRSDVRLDRIHAAHIDMNIHIYVPRYIYIGMYRLGVESRKPRIRISRFNADENSELARSRRLYPGIKRRLLQDGWTCLVPLLDRG